MSKCSELGSEVILDPLNLVSLHLDDNKIKSVSKDVFSSLKNLKRLSLNSNQIENFTMNSVDGLMQLEELSLSMKIYLWRSIVSSDFLRLGFNKLNSVSIDTHQNMKKLKQLSFSSNQIRTIVNITFEGFTALEKLKLGNLKYYLKQ